MRNEEQWSDAIESTIAALVGIEESISGSRVAELVADELEIEQTELLKSQCTREVRRWYLRDVRMPSARRALAFVGCANPDAFTLTVASIDEQEMPFIGPSGKKPSPEAVTAFREAYAIACGVLGVSATEPDLRPIWLRTEDEVSALERAYRFAGAAINAEAEALEAERQRRFRAY